MSEKQFLYCKQHITRVGFRPPGGSFPEEPQGPIVMFEEKGAVLICNRDDPHEHEWPGDYKPLNPKSR